MSLPGAGAVIRTLDATWPSASIAQKGPVELRYGPGGKRVSAARAKGPLTETDIETAEQAMAAAGQVPLFMVTPGEEDLDRQLAALGYAVIDPVTLYVCPLEQGPGPVTTAWPPRPEDKALWADGGIGADRIDVMERVTGPKAVLADGTPPRAVVFSALGAGGAMIHALHVDPASRRRGLARSLCLAAARWAAAEGAPWIGLAVTDDNIPANALYRALGYAPVGRYWYRIKEG
ncbi:MAG: GNAT family N-acetyltransferase [Pseudomonadota bacterium]